MICALSALHTHTKLLKYCAYRYIRLACTHLLIYFALFYNEVSVASTTRPQSRCSDLFTRGLIAKSEQLTFEDFNSHPQLQKALTDLATMFKSIHMDSLDPNAIDQLVALYHQKLTELTDNIANSDLGSDQDSNAGNSADRSINRSVDRSINRVKGNRGDGVKGDGDTGGDENTQSPLRHQLHALIVNLAGQQISTNTAIADSPNSGLLTEVQTQIAMQRQLAKLSLNDRTPQVKQKILKALNKDEADITWRDLASIAELDLSNMNITELKPHDFYGLTGLTTLDLYGNQISHLHEDIFKHNTQLTDLYIYNNQLSHLHVDIFKNNTRLTLIFLGGNFLSQLYADTFKNNVFLIRLDLENNPLDTRSINSLQRRFSKGQLWL